jgi:hypothetical protein
VRICRDSSSAASRSRDLHIRTDFHGTFIDKS